MKPTPYVRVESDAFLAALAEGEPVVAALRKRVLAFLSQQTPTQTNVPRTLQQLLRRAEALEQVEHTRQVEVARKKHIAEMEALAACAAPGRS